MATNVSSLRVAIRGDVSGLEASLMKGQKSVNEFSKTLAASATAKQGLAGPQGLDRQLSEVRRQIDAVAEAYVTGGKVARSDIDSLIAKERQLQSQIEARKTLLQSARGTGGDLQERAMFGPFLPAGGIGVVKLQAKTERDAREAAIAQSRRLASAQMQVAAASRHVAGGSSRASMAVTQLGFAAEDAAVVYGTTGLAGALRAAGNNLSFVASMFNPFLGVFIGVGAALSAIFIPRLLDADKRVNGLAEAFRNLRKSMELARLELQIGKGADPLSVEGIHEPKAPNRFQQQRTEFKDQLRDQKTELLRARRELQLALEGAGARSDSLVSSFMPGTGEATRSLGLALARDLQTATQNAIKSGDITGIQRAFQNRLMQAEGLSKTLGFSVDETAVSKTQAYVDELTKLATRQIEAAKAVEQYNTALGDLAKNEAEADKRKAVKDLLSPAGNAVADVAAGFWQDMQTAAQQRDQFKAIAKERERERRARGTGELQAGSQFGSREAVSTLNRAMFRNIGEKKEEKEIAKNTHGTEVAVRDVVRAVKDLGAQFVPALAGDAL